MNRYFVFFVCIMLNMSVLAQQRPLYNSQQQTTIDKNSKTLRVDYQQRQEKIKALSAQHNWPLYSQNAAGGVMILADVSQTGQPIYEATDANITASATTRASALYMGGVLGLNLSGSDVSLRDRIAIWDGGKILDTHSELNGRLRQLDVSATLSAHATHVSGTMIAAGLNPRVRGMANAASLIAYDFTNDVAEMNTESSRLLISNHSYGVVSGWRYNADRPGTNTNLKWEWYGDTTVNDKQDYKYGFYDSKSRELDRMAMAAPYYLMVKSAGNDRNSSGPTGGAPYFFAASTRTSTTPRDPQTDYDLIGTYGTAKNILTVGAINGLPNGANVIADAQISSFSSWGPTDDGRIKPDIVGMGVNLFSLNSTNDNSYTTMSGTSMSSPNVSGSLILLQELYQIQNKAFMRAATLKGLVLHTADDAGRVGPDYIFGWGVMNTQKAAEAILNRNNSFQISEKTLNTNETYTQQITASGYGPLAVTICWTDPEAVATVTNAAGFNNRTPKLVNDLDIRISDGTTQFFPWLLDPEKPAALATQGDNFRDNSEQILIANAVPGRTYTITIKHKGTLTNTKQDYSLIISGIGGKNYCDSKATTNTDTKITRVSLGIITQNAPAGCQSYNDFTNQVADLVSGQAVPLSVSVGTCGADFGKVVKVFADWNNDGDFDDANENIATSDVLQNTSTFQTNITSPGGLAINNRIRLRIVCTETTDAKTVTACETYPKGETQEYLLRIIRPTVDVMVDALLSPENDFCGNQNSSVTVRIRNVGSVAQSNIPITTEVYDGPVLIGTLKGTVSQVVAAFSEATISLSAPFLSNLQAGKSYIFVSKTELNNDQDPTNNTLRDSRKVAAPLSAPTATATFCGSDPLALLTKGNGTAFWYSSPTASSPIAVGNVVGSNFKQGTYYVALNDFSGSIGPATKALYGGGSYGGSFGPSPLIKTETPLVIESARLYIADAGRLTFNVLGLDDRFISTVTLDVKPTRNANAPNIGAPSGQVADDLNDGGAVYTLNLAIPKAGDYKITIEYEGGASIFRSNANVTGFPYIIPNVMTLRGALFNRTTTQVDTLTNAYYYLYDLKVKALGCASPRVAVATQTATKAQPTAVSENNLKSFCVGQSLKLTATEGLPAYQWFLDDKAIGGATNSTHQATVAGNYVVSAAANNCLPSASNAIAVTTRTAEKPTITKSGYELTANGSNVQWLLNGNTIANATQKKWGVTQTGGYTVQADVNGCGRATSDVLSVVVNETLDKPKNGDFVFILFPNPSPDYVIGQYLSKDPTERAVVLTIYDTNGKLVIEKNMEQNINFFKSKINIQNLQCGTFFAIITDSNGSVPLVRRFMRY
jgi:Subtilase family/GEVED domain/Secretion system C-terminal sorting domain